MRRRHGFTVLELLVALTLTAVALTLTGTALSAARSTEAAIDRSRSSTLPSAQARELLTDLLRHLPRPDEVDGPLLTLVSGDRTPALTFLSRGLDAPLGTGPIWSIRLSQRGDSVVIEAAPLRAGADVVPRRLLIPHAAALEIDALVALPGGEVERRPDWSSPVQRPTALGIRWGHGADRVTGTALLVSLDPLGDGR